MLTRGDQRRASSDQLAHLLAEAAEDVRLGQADGIGRDPQLGDDFRRRAGLDGRLPERGPGPVLGLVPDQAQGALVQPGDVGRVSSSSAGAGTC
jgi:hypothetical protein